MNSKTVGNAYEREACRIISAWLTGKKDSLICWRNVHSGTVGTVRAKKNLKSGAGITGDLICTDPEYQWFFDHVHVDSKTFKDINLAFHDGNKKNKLIEEWRKVKKEAGSKLALMPVKPRNRKVPPFVITDIQLPSAHITQVQVPEAFFIIYYQKEFFTKEMRDLFEDAYCFSEVGNEQEEDNIN